MRRRGYLYFEDEPGRRAAAIRVSMTQGWFRMIPAVRLGGMGFPEQRLTSNLPKPITAPRQFDSVGYSLRHLCRDTSQVLLGAPAGEAARQPGFPS
jgi:hypothetical protein